MSDCTRVAPLSRRVVAPPLSTLAAALAALADRRGALDEPALGVIVFRGDGSFQVRVALGSAALVVGRHDACDLQLAEGDASLRHLLVCGDDSGVVAHDLASTHGVLGHLHAPPGLPLVAAAGGCFVSAFFACRGMAFPSVKSTVMMTLTTPVTARRQGPRRDGWRPLGAGVLPLPIVGLEAPVLIGRSARNDVVVDSDTASRVHAAVVCCGGRALLVDVGSTNGTTIVRGRRGERVLALGPARRAAAVEEGDVVVLGQGRLRVVTATPRPASLYARCDRS